MGIKQKKRHKQTHSNRKYGYKSAITNYFHPQKIKMNLLQRNTNKRQKKHTANNKKDRKKNSKQ